MLGATGWLGMVSLELLASALGESFTQRVSGWASRERAVQLRAGDEIAVRDLRELGPADVDGALVLHFAFLTRDRVSAMGADEFLRENRAITDRVLSVFGAAAPLALVYASSGAVYDPAGGFVADAQANPYGAAKRLDELAFQAACRATGASCVIPRVFSVSGPYMTKPELYALGDLVLQAHRNDRLEIRAAHPVYRSYVALGDLLSVCVAAALAGERDLLFDSGGEIVEVGELAELVRQNAGRADLPIERAWDPSAAADRYVGDDAAAGALARRFGVTRQSLPEQVAETAADLLQRTGP